MRVCVNVCVVCVCVCVCDLKPDNMLSTQHGFVKVADMGLAKFVIGKTYITCSTPDYVAPELIVSEGHTNVVDWWTLGILISDLMSGHTPFDSAQPMQSNSKCVRVCVCGGQPGRPLAESYWGERVCVCVCMCVCVCVCACVRSALSSACGVVQG